MISQEKIYQHVLKEEWEPVISLLHQHRKDIATDPMLSQSAIVFEQEFFRKVEAYPTTQSDIVPVAL